MKDWDFNKSLQARGLNQTRLAALVNCSRSHLCQVLNNRVGRGGQTRRKLYPHLTAVEIRSLGWLQEFEEWRASRAAAAGQAWRPGAPHVPLVPQGTKLQEIEQ